MSRGGGRGGYVVLSGGTPTEVPAPQAWAAAKPYVLDNVVTVGSGATALQAQCILNHLSASSGLSVRSGELDGADKAKWRLVPSGAITALRNWSYNTTESTTTLTYVNEDDDRTVGTGFSTTGQIVFADDSGPAFDVAQNAAIAGNLVAMTIYPFGVKSGEPQYVGDVRFSSDSAAFSAEVQERTVDFAVQGAWTRSVQA